jgi:cell wall-associated NlpC family hydrolase
MLAKYSGASGGDIYFYDWGKGEGWSHAAISTNSGTFANYYSPADTLPYSAVTGGSGDRVAQHSNDRVDSPWNFGFYIETDKPIRDNMQTIVYHLN